MKIRKLTILITQNIPEKLQDIQATMTRARTQFPSEKSLDLIENQVTDLSDRITEAASIWTSTQGLSATEFNQVIQIIRAIVETNLDYLKESKRRQAESAEDARLYAYRKDIELTLMVNTKLLADFLYTLESLA